MAEGTTAPPAAVPAANAPKGAAPVVPPITTPKAEEATETIKVNGKDVKVTPAELRKLAQKGYFADQTLKSTDVLKKNASALIDALKTPEGVIKVLQDKSLGNSPKAVLKALLASDLMDDEAKEELSRWVYDKVVVAGKKTPEQLEQEKKLSDYERLKKQEDERKLADLTKQQQEKVQAVYTAVRAEVTKQIVADKTFPQVEGSIRAVVDKLRVMNKKGAPLTSETIGKAIEQVKKDHVLHQQALFDAIEDPEALIAMVGEARALKISKALVARLQNKAKAKTETQAKPAEGVREKVTERIDKKLGRERHGYQVLDI